MIKKWTLLAPDDGYQIFAKAGTLEGRETRREVRNTQIRIVPFGPGWGSTPLGVDGITLGTLEEDGDGMRIVLDGQTIKLDYSQLAYLKYLLEAHERIDPPWWDSPQWQEEEWNYDSE